MSEKHYNWNRNASTHREAIIKFSTVSFVATLPVSVMTAIMALPLARCGDSATVRQVVILAPIVHMLSWAILLLFMCLIYYMMNESNHSVKTPPTPPINDSELWWYPAGNGLYKPGKPGGKGKP